MQTFLPYPEFQMTVKVLDYRRLGKQRVECLQILNAMDSGKGWSKHPATVMWSNYRDALMVYGNFVIREWIHRGYKNNMPYWDTPKVAEMPWWLGDERLHASHRSNLLRKDPEWYGNFNWKESNDLEYWWPSASPV